MPLCAGGADALPRHSAYTCSSLALDQPFLYFARKVSPYTPRADEKGDILKEKMLEKENVLHEETLQEDYSLASHGVWSPH